MKQFKAESKRLLDLMINSIYTHKEIFLRELISNASDAMDKLYYKALSENNTGLNREDFAIWLIPNKEERTLTIRDNGIGMTKEDLDNNLGVIAKSGSLQFKREMDKSDDKDVDIIGQFGVGFYSAFMLADPVTVTSRAFGSEEANRWESKGVEGYTISSAEKDAYGTEIVLHIKPSSEEENYDEYLDAYRLRMLVKKYSDYIRYPICMDMERSRPKEDNKDEYETYTETVTLNSMVPLWKKNKKEIADEEYNNFYKEKFFDWQDPLRVIHSSAEGTATYNALLFIPGKAPMDYYSKEFQKGLQLYASGVMIMDKCADLLPDCFSFVRGLVDSQDLSLNISREMLQHDRQLKLIAGRIEKKIRSELLTMLKNDREKYEQFYKSFGLQLKYGMYENYGANKEMLKDLILFHSTREQKLVSLAEYVEHMPEGQKDIYYACGESVGQIEALPQAERLKDKGYEILCFTDSVDEFAIKMLETYSEKAFKNISADELDLETEEEKEQIKQKAEENKAVLDAMKEALGDKVKSVVLTNRLKSHPVCLTTEGQITLEMERVLSAMPGAEGMPVKAERVLEINAQHPVFATLCGLLESDGEKLELYTELLYAQALLIEGMKLDDPVAFSNGVCSLMV